MSIVEVLLGIHSQHKTTLQMYEENLASVLFRVAEQSKTKKTIKKFSFLHAILHQKIRKKITFSIDFRRH